MDNNKIPHFITVEEMQEAFWECLPEMLKQIDINDIVDFLRKEGVDIDEKFKGINQ